MLNSEIRHAQAANRRASWPVAVDVDPGESSKAAWLALTTLATALAVPSAAAWSQDHSPGMIALASFIPHIALSAAFVWNECKRRAMSLHLMHALFAFLFFGVAALAQFLHRKFPLSDYYPMALADDEVIWANIVVTVWLLSYYVGHRVTIFGRWSPVARPAVITRLGLLVATICSVVCLGALALRGSFGVLTRAGFDTVVGVGSGTEALVIGVFVRGVPIVTTLAFTAAAVQSRRRRLPNAIAAVVLGIGCILLDNPIAAARYWTAMVVIAFATVLLFRRPSWRWALVPAVVLGVVFAMPVLDRGRYSPAPDFFGTPDEMFGRSLSEDGNYDAFGNVALTARYVNDVGSTWGRQFLGTVTFFIPRSAWPDKPVGSGSLVANRYGLPNTNISSPLPAEGLINFGLLGVVLFGVACGALVRRLDHVSSQTGCSFTWRSVVYPCWLGLFFFICRGDLLSSVAYTIGTTCAALPLCIRSGKKKRFGWTVGRFACSRAS